MCLDNEDCRNNNLYCDLVIGTCLDCTDLCMDEDSQYQVACATICPDYDGPLPTTFVTLPSTTSPVEIDNSTPIQGDKQHGDLENNLKVYLSIATIIGLLLTIIIIVGIKWRKKIKCTKKDEENIPMDEFGGLNDSPDGGLLNGKDLPDERFLNGNHPGGQKIVTENEITPDICDSQSEANIGSIDHETCSQQDEQQNCDETGPYLQNQACRPIFTGNDNISKLHKKPSKDAALPVIAYKTSHCMQPGSSVCTRAEMKYRETGNTKDGPQLPEDEMETSHDRYKSPVQCSDHSSCEEPVVLALYPDVILEDHRNMRTSHEQIGADNDDADRDEPRPPPTQEEPDTQVKHC